MLVNEWFVSSVVVGVISTEYLLYAMRYEVCARERMLLALVISLYMCVCVHVYLSAICNTCVCVV